MADDLLGLAADLQRRGEPFALATVVRCEAPTSAKAGAKALVRADGSVMGWVGGACAEPVVVREALASLRDGRPRLIGLLGEGARPAAGSLAAARGASGLGMASASVRGPARTEGMLEYPMTCHSGGTLEIYVEPYLPKPLLVLVGHGPVVESLATLARDADHAVVALGGHATRERLGALALTARASVVVATHGDDDEGVLAHVLATDAGYVSLVASRRRAAVIVEALKRRGVTPERLNLLKAPAGLDIGAQTPEEIAVSILAEIVQHRRSAKAAEGAGRDSGTEGIGREPAGAGPTEATDPICGMLVDIATARHRSEVSGRVVYFCCPGCKETFDRDPQRHLATLG